MFRLKFKFAHVARLLSAMPKRKSEADCDIDVLLKKRTLAYADNETRVKVYLPSGVQIGLPGVGENERNRLTFPACFQAGDALKADVWIRAATEQECMTPIGFEFAKPPWYVVMHGLKVKALVHSNGAIANQYDPLGMHGVTLTALDTEVTQEFETRPCCSLDDVKTPTTPSPQSDISH